MPGVSDLGKLFGKGSPAEQLLIWQVLAQFVGAVMGPELEMLTRAVNEVLQSTPLSPADLADMVVRNIVAQGDAEAYAKQSGVSPEDFDRLVHSSGEPPSLTEAIELLRRGIIPRNGTGPGSTSFEQIVAESRLFTKYTDAVLQLGDVPLSVADAVDGVVKGQIDFQTGQSQAFLSGVSGEHFQVLVDTAGNPPSPMELNVLHNRGLIPLNGTGPDVLSVQQGIAEGRTKNKWFPMFAALAQYVPPARTVVSLLREGTVTDAEALALLKQSGLTDNLAEKYIQSAHIQNAKAHRDIAASDIRSTAKRGFLSGQLSEAQYRQLLASVDIPAASIDEEVQAANLSKQLGRHTFSLATIKHMRQHGEIDDAQARQRLVAAGWNEDDATAQVNEWINEAKIGHPGITESRVLAYLVSGVIDATKAYDLLTGLGINSDQAHFLVTNPSAGPVHKPHGSSAGDIIAAYKDDILTQDEAQAKLVAANMTADAAALRLRVANVAKNRGPKPRGPGKQLSEAHILEAFRLGFAADTWTQRELVALGYSDDKAALLVAIEETKVKPVAPPSWSVLT